ncbi:MULTISPECIES: helix-turn-helix domain-containing protein [unclassified Caballeronia]|uniref:helix-turn-helix domain-containing protein n=1 Tax=unclassified Caballeronia TaxID=2646786 RepID=UPI002029A215|nr:MULTISPECIES: helix-turn-helix domain-containing protein [unclassified Caballeronia]
MAPANAFESCRLQRDLLCHPRLRRAVHLIEQHIGAPLRVEALATRLDTSPRQLQRLFKEGTGESPLAYALRIRLKTAAWLLAGTHRTVSDIAGHCGFFDASHMGRQFRRVYGVTPQGYRMRHHAELSAVRGYPESTSPAGQC